MRPFRNLRFAPESLESRLSPSTLPPADVVYVASTDTPPPPDYPLPGDTPPPPRDATSSPADRPEWTRLNFKSMI